MKYVSKSFNMFLKHKLNEKTKEVNDEVNTTNGNDEVTITLQRKPLGIEELMREFNEIMDEYDKIYKPKY